MFVAFHAFNNNLISSLLKEFFLRIVDKKRASIQFKNKNKFVEEFIFMLHSKINKPKKLNLFCMSWNIKTVN